MKLIVVLLHDLALGKFRLTIHAIERMRQRSISTADIKRVGSTGRVEQQVDGKFKVQGLDCDGVSLIVIAIYEEGILIITVY